MKNEVVCAVLSVPVESLPYKFNEAEDVVVQLKLRMSSIFQQAAVDSDFTVMSNGEFGVPLWSLETALAAKNLGHPIKTSIVVPCDEQDTGWAEQWRDRYYNLIQQVDSAPALPPEYTDICSSTEDRYDAADNYMVDNCDMVLAVKVDDELPDAAETAKEKGKPIMYIDAATLEVTQ